MKALSLLEKEIRDLFSLQPKGKDNTSDVSSVIKRSGGKSESSKLEEEYDFSYSSDSDEDSKEDSNNSEPDKESKEEDSLFLEDSEYTENKEENASFQGEFILVIPTKLDDPILIIDERQKYNESKEEIERILLENQEVKILYEDFSYNALLIEHVLKAPTSVTLFGDINYEEILLQA